MVKYNNDHELNVFDDVKRVSRMYILEKISTALKNRENHKVFLKDCVRPNEEPWLANGSTGESPCVPRVHCYYFQLLDVCQNVVTKPENVSTNKIKQMYLVKNTPS